ncbi:MAG: polysaccharide biosynthesis tyrosine autokinase [Desulfobacterales bacterium]|nr:polysaccharide biosynthesis tyrosine autokinase [Desulfobacterales bacterium]
MNREKTLDTAGGAPANNSGSTAQVILEPGKLQENRCVCISSDSVEVEIYKLLRTQILQRTREKGWNTIMITSALPDEGKTLTAINLALTFAKEFAQTVLLVDCDLKRQDIHKRLGVDSPKGLIDYLVDEVPISELLIRPDIEDLTFISGGRTIQESTELIGSPKMKDLIVEMKNRYKDRYIFFETPPVLYGADAVAFAPLVDGILFVVQAGRTSIQNVKKALALLPEEKFLGFVLNRTKITKQEYAIYRDYYQ